MPIPKKFFDQEGNETTLEELCRIEPEWAANSIKALHRKYDELLASITAVQADSSHCSHVWGKSNFINCRRCIKCSMVETLN